MPDVSILPYFADAIGVRTCSECKIYVRNSYSAQDLLTTNRLINRHDPTFNADVDRVLVVTWYRNKGYYSNQVYIYPAGLFGGSSMPGSGGGGGGR